MDREGTLRIRSLAPVAVTLVALVATLPGARADQGQAPSGQLPLGVYDPADQRTWTQATSTTIAPGVIYTKYTQGYASSADKWVVDVSLTKEAQAVPCEGSDPTPLPSSPGAATGVYTISCRTQADALVTELDKQGVTARVDVITAPTTSAEDSSTPTAEPSVPAPTASTGDGVLPGGTAGYVVRVYPADAADSSSSSGAATSLLDTVVRPAGFTGQLDYTAQDGNPTTGPWTVRVVSIAPNSGEQLQLTHGTDMSTPETLRSMAAGSSALVAVNAGESVPAAAAPGAPVSSAGYSGITEGLEVEHDDILGTANNHRTALLMNSPVPGRIAIDEVSTAVSVTAPDGASHPVAGALRIPGHPYGCGQPGAVLGTVDMSNQALRNGSCTSADDLVVFRPEWGPTTPTGPSGSLEVVMDSSWVVQQVRSPAGGPLGSGQRSLQATGAAVDWLRAHATRGTQLTPHGAITDDSGASVAAPDLFAVAGGGPTLVRDGQISINARENGLVSPQATHANAGMAQRHPRTLVGVKADGTQLLVVVDGRDPATSVGVNWTEAAALMKALGAEDAMALGSGGDSALMIQGTMYSQPMDHWGADTSTVYERPLSEALVLVPSGESPFVFAGVADWNQDGFPDLVAEDTNGVLWLYPGDAAHDLSTQRVELASGLAGYAFAGIADTNHDGYPDLVARDPSGNLYLYPGDAGHDLATPRKLIGTGWGSLSFVGLTDWNGDGNPDILVKDTSGVIWNYPGNADGTHGTRVQVSTGWTGTTPLGAVDWNGDGRADVVARDASGNLYLYPADASHGLSAATRTLLGTGWGAATVAGLGDWNGDGVPDLLARDASGRLQLYPGTGTTAPLGSPTQVGPQADW